MQAAGQTITRFPSDTAGEERPDQGTTTSPSDGRRLSAQRDLADAGIEAPTNEEVQSALFKALKSSEFQSAPQLRSFLGFVVHATLNNQQEKIKGYTIAVEALGRPDDFNPVTDPIVRVEAARLRRRLDTYYGGSGADDRVRIKIPKGSYAPSFYLAGSGPAPDRLTNELSACDGGPTIVEDGLMEDTGLSSKSALPDRGCGSTAFSAADRTGKAASRAADFLLSLSGRRIALGYALAVGAACFLAGYFAASL